MTAADSAAISAANTLMLFEKARGDKRTEMVQRVHHNPLLIRAALIRDSI